MRVLLDESLHHFGRADELLVAGSGRELWLRDSGARIKSALAGVQLLRGELGEVPTHVAASLALCADGPNTPIVRVGNHAICASILALLGDRRGAGDLARRTLELADDENDDFRAVATTVGWASGVVARSDAVLAAADTMLTRPTVPFPLGLVVFFGADLLPPDELLALLDRTRAQCARVDTHWADPEFLRVRARLVLETAGDVEQAAELLAEAISLADRHGSVFFRDRASVDLAR